MEGTNTIKTYKLGHSATALLQDIKINQAVTQMTEQESRKRNTFLLGKPMFTVSCALFNGMFPFLWDKFMSWALRSKPNLKNI